MSSISAILIRNRSLVFGSPRGKRSVQQPDKGGEGDDSFWSTYSRNPYADYVPRSSLCLNGP